MMTIAEIIISSTGSTRTRSVSLCFYQLVALSLEGPLALRCDAALPRLYLAHRRQARLALGSSRCPGRAGLGLPAQAHAKTCSCTKSDSDYALANANKINLLLLRACSERTGPRLISRYVLGKAT